jgi:hypothetical protein
MLFSSCATIINGSRQQITIQSLTKGSNISVDEVEIGNDSLRVRLKRNRNHVIAFTKEGDGAAAWMIVDAATGSWNKFDRDVVIVELEKSTF